MFNKWKIAFFALLFFILLIVAIPFYFFFSNSQSFDESQLNNELRGTDKLFSIHMDKRELEYLMNKEIRSKKDNLDLYVQLNNDIQITGKIHVFDRAIPFQLFFVPKSLENGDLTLKEKGMSVSGLSLPGEQILGLLAETPGIPDWVTIYPKNRLIHLATTKIDLQKKYKIKVNQFNLPENRLIFDVYQK